MTDGPQRRHQLLIDGRWTDAVHGGTFESIDAVWINCYNVFDAALPFGGFKQSGWGKEMGAEAIDGYLQSKAVTVSLSG